ncbi:MAG: hypothetical protein C5B56_00545 [Proteobacteria bacterium]|nr:MAG: hypothetical protein C5B56_00545 [Pseudomonadota bacterium]
MGAAANGGASFTTTMATTDTTKPAKARRTFVLELRPEPGVDPILALRALLKVALRRFGLKCVSAHESNEGDKNARPNPE